MQAQPAQNTPAGRPPLRPRGTVRRSAVRPLSQVQSARPPGAPAPSRCSVRPPRRRTQIPCARPASQHFGELSAGPRCNPRRQSSVHRSATFRYPQPRAQHLSSRRGQSSATGTAQTSPRRVRRPPGPARAAEPAPVPRPPPLRGGGRGFSQWRAAHSANRGWRGPTPGPREGSAYARRVAPGSVSDKAWLPLAPAPTPAPSALSPRPGCGEGCAPPSTPVSRPSACLGLLHPNGGRQRSPSGRAELQEWSRQAL